MTDAGASLHTGAPVVRMVGDRALEIEADVPFQRLSGVREGTRVGVVLDDGTTHAATVRAIVPEENPLTRTRAVRFVPEFGATSRPLATEQSVTVYIPASAPRNVLTVHKDAVIKRGPKSLVYVVEDDTAEARQITLGEPTGSRYEVLDGLSEGEAVVVRGNERLRPGDKVRIDGAS
jgi:RND family efflux transporter MFP subunit